MRQVSDEAIAQAYLRHRGSIRATAKALGLSRHKVKRHLEKEGLDLRSPVSGGAVHAFKTTRRPLPKKGSVKYYLITSIQNNTNAHPEFFDSLLTYANHLGAEILVARYSYNRASYGAKAEKPDRGPTADDVKALWFDPIFDPYICDDRLELAPMLVFCGEVNILPTAKRPLSGFETYAGRQSAIFPHSKLAMESIPGMPSDGTKFNYTTGTATLMNYIQKKAGLQAEHHHTYGALIVEVDHHGTWFVRQINAQTDGSFYDLDTFVSRASVTQGHRVEAINWGDIHCDVLDLEAYQLAFGEGGILDTLKPSHQFIHDVLDFRSRNHHERGNPHRMFQRYIERGDDVRDEVQRVRDLLDDLARDWCTMVVVDSNHDNALERWLREADYRQDPKNALFFLECQLDKYRAIESDDKNHHVLREALRREGLSRHTLFLGPDDSFVLCDDGSGGIEFAMHGHLGPSGSKGTPLGLSKIGRRANTGHTHAAQIIDGLYVAGTMTRLRLEYTKGPSAWSHSIIVTYPNGKRAIITFYAGKWRATPQ